MNSASELTGSDAGTTSTVGELAINVIGSRSVCGSKPSLLVERRIGGEPEARDQQRVAVGLRADDRQRGEVGVGARPVEHHEGLAEPPGEAVAQHAGSRSRRRRRPGRAPPARPGARGSPARGRGDRGHGDSDRHDHRQMPRSTYRRGSSLRVPGECSERSERTSDPGPRSALRVASRIPRVAAQRAPLNAHA